MMGIVLYLLILILIGGIICFKGKKIFFPTIMLITFILTVLMYTAYFGTSNKSLLISIALGIVLAIIVRFLYNAAFFISGFVVGEIITRHIILNFLHKSTEGYMWIGVLLGAMLVGLLALRWQKFFIALSTALSGASTIAMSVCFLATNFNKLNQFTGNKDFLANIVDLTKYLRGEFTIQHQNIIIIVTVIMFIIGFISQQKSQDQR